MISMCISLKRHERARAASSVAIEAYAVSFDGDNTQHGRAAAITFSFSLASMGFLPIRAYSSKIFAF